MTVDSLLMFDGKRKSGFTLTEVLISAGILAIGFMLIAGAFPVGVKLTATATERSIGSVASQEAEAKIRLHGINDATLFSSKCRRYVQVFGVAPATFDEMKDGYYPTTNLIEVEDKKYHWTALCRRVGANEAQLNIFVCRLGGEDVSYPDPDVAGDVVDVPKPFKVDGLTQVDTDKFEVPAGYKSYFSEGTVIVDNVTGASYTVMERNLEPSGDWTIVLDAEPPPPLVFNGFWVIPSPVFDTTKTPMELEGRWPCVYHIQTVIEY